MTGKTSHMSHASRKSLLCCIVHGGSLTDGDVKIDVDSTARRILLIRPTCDLASFNNHLFFTYKHRQYPHSDRGAKHQQTNPTP